MSAIERVPVGVSVPDALGRAAAAVAAGRLCEAERICRAVLLVEPDHFDAITRLAIVQHRRGRPTAALESLDRALALRPDCAETLGNRGIVLHALNRFAEALASHHAALAIRPDAAALLNNLGITLETLQRFDEALVRYDAAIAAAPHDAAAFNNRGNVLHRLHRHDDALASYDRALALDPNHLAALTNRGHLLKDLKRPEAALASYDAALRIAPDHVEALYGRGLVLQDLGRLDDALASYDRALAVDPHRAAVLRDRGIVLRSIRRLDEALSAFDSALRLRPGFAEALCDRGLVLQAMDRLDEALASFDAALTARPDFVEARNNRANLLMDLDRPEAALADYDRALAHRPDFAAAQFGRSLSLLLQGDYEGGWRAYESRWSTNPMPVPDRPLWLGDADIGGRTILLRSEQGLGDTLQFCRYAGLVAGRGARVILEVPRELATLMTSLDPAPIVVVAGDPLPEFDFYTPLLSLPLAFGTTLDTIPAPRHYLRAPGRKVAMWRNRLGPPTRPRVGLVWAGNPKGGQRSDRLRSIPFDHLAPVLTAADCTFYSLQKGGDAAAQLQASPHRGDVVDWSDAFVDFSDTAALVACLDLVITVDTSVAHLAGALGTPFWLMNRRNTCWRWLRARTDSPWYPSARIFRQPAFGAWTPVVEEVAAALRRRFRDEPEFGRSRDP